MAGEIKQSEGTSDQRSNRSVKSRTGTQSSLAAELEMQAHVAVAKVFRVKVCRCYLNATSGIATCPLIIILAERMRTTDFALFKLVALVPFVESTLTVPLVTPAG